MNKSNLYLILFIILLIQFLPLLSAKSDIYISGKINLPKECRTVTASYELVLQEDNSVLSGTISIEPWMCRVDQLCSHYQCTWNYEHTSCMKLCDDSSESLRDSLIYQKSEHISGSVSGKIQGNTVTIVTNTDAGEFRISGTINKDPYTGKLTFSGQLDSSVTCEPGVYVKGSLSGNGMIRERKTISQPINESSIFVSGKLNLPAGCRYLVSEYYLDLTQKGSKLSGNLNSQTWHCRVDGFCNAVKCKAGTPSCYPDPSCSSESLRDSLLRTKIESLVGPAEGSINGNSVNLVVTTPYGDLSISGTLNPDPSTGKLTFSGQLDSGFTCEPGVYVKGSLSGTGLRNEFVQPQKAKLGENCSADIPCEEGICSSGICVKEPNCLTGTTACGSSCCALSQSCVDGSCSPQFCASGLVQCGISCIDPLTDKFNCGSCGNACGEGFKCVNSACVPIDISYVNCSGTGIGTDIANWNVKCNSGDCIIKDGIFSYSGLYSGRFSSQNDRGTISFTISKDGIVSGSIHSEIVGDTIPIRGSFSGSSFSSSGTAYNVGENGSMDIVPVSISGSCVPSSCPAGYIQDNAACLAPNDRDNCGKLGNMCSDNQICSDGNCISCGSGLSVCNNICVNLLSDSYNCGSCGKTCPFGTFCSNGKCMISPSCVINNMRYVACGKSCCNFGQYCDTQTMTCQPASSEIILNNTLLQCGPNIIDPLSDPNNCGFCTNKCGSDETCTNGVCTKLETCGNGVCGQNESCSTCPQDCGSCIETGCNKEYPTLCGDKCVNTLNDSQNCGSCGTVCDAGQTCDNGKCASVINSECQTNEDCAYGYCINNSCQLKNCISDSDCNYDEYCNLNLGVCDGGCRISPDNCAELIGKGTCDENNRECVVLSCPSGTVLINNSCFSLTTTPCNESQQCGSGLCYNNTCVSDSPPVQPIISSTKVGKPSFGSSKTATPKLFREQPNQAASDAFYSLLGTSKTRLLAYDKCLRGSICSSSDDCCGAPCLDSRCACSNSVCISTADCCNGYCQNGKCVQSPKTSLSLFNSIENFQGCAGLIEECSPDEKRCISVCNGLSGLLLLVSVGFGAYSWRRFNHPVAGIAAAFAPILIGLAIYPFVGIISGILLFALFIYKDTGSIEI